MYFSPDLKTPNVEFSVSFWIGWCMQYKEAASGSSAIINLSSQIPTYLKFNMVNKCIRITHFPFSNLFIDWYFTDRVTKNRSQKNHIAQILQNSDKSNFIVSNTNKLSLFLLNKNTPPYCGLILTVGIMIWTNWSLHLRMHPSFQISLPNCF